MLEQLGQVGHTPKIFTNIPFLENIENLIDCKYLGELDEVVGQLGQVGHPLLRATLL
jgi:hypothetical protein